MTQTKRKGRFGSLEASGELEVAWSVEFCRGSVNLAILEGFWEYSWSVSEGFGTIGKPFCRSFGCKSAVAAGQGIKWEHRGN